MEKIDLVCLQKVYLDLAKFCAEYREKEFDIKHRDYLSLENYEKVLKVCADGLNWARIDDRTIDFMEHTRSVYGVINSTKKMILELKDLDQIFEMVVQVIKVAFAYFLGNLDGINNECEQLEKLKKKYK